MARPWRAFNFIVALHIIRHIDSFPWKIFIYFAEFHEKYFLGGARYSCNYLQYSGKIRGLKPQSFFSFSYFRTFHRDQFLCLFDISLLTILIIIFIATWSIDHVTIKIIIHIVSNRLIIFLYIFDSVTAFNILIYIPKINLTLYLLTRELFISVLYSFVIKFARRIY